MHGKDTQHIQFSLCSRKKLTNFSSRQTVCEPFVDGAAQVCSPIHKYSHLVCKPFDTLVYMRLYLMQFCCMCGHGIMQTQSQHLTSLCRHYTYHYWDCKPKSRILLALYCTKNWREQVGTDNQDLT